MHITQYPDRCYVHQEQPDGTILNAFTANLGYKIVVFTSQLIYNYDRITGKLRNASDPNGLPELSANNWHIGHIPNNPNTP